MYEAVIIGNPAFNRFSSDTRAARVFSGSTAYSARTLAQLGHQEIAAIGRIGADYLDEYTEALLRLGDLEHYNLQAEATGGLEFKQAADGSFQVAKCIGTGGRVGVKDIPEEFLNSEILLLSPLLQETDEEFIQWVCDSSDALILLNPQLHRLDRNGNLEPIDGYEAFEKTQCYIDYVQINYDDAVLFTGEDDPFVAAELIVDAVSEKCIITLGRAGSVLYDGSRFVRVPSLEVKPIDIFGVGPVHFAAFASGLLEKKSLEECLSIAAAATSIKMEQKGLEFSLHPEEMEQRTQALLSSVSVQ
jgi:sugar/nucleoside kinase (ribokinase family)